MLRMLSTPTIVALALGVAVTAMAGEEPSLPRGAPPRFALVAEIGGNWILLREVHHRGIAHVERHGNELRQVTKLSQETRLREYGLDKVGVFTAEGKGVPAQDALKRLAVGSMVLVSADGRPVEAAYLKLCKADTLVFVPPQEDAGKLQPVPAQRQRQKENEREKEREREGESENSP